MSSKIQKVRKDNFSQFYLNLSTAFFVGGILTPWLTKASFTPALGVNVILSLLMSYFFLYSSWIIYK